jgi:hypothetical protein
LGESVIIGFLKEFPGDCVGDISVGTGVAGIFATFTNLGFKAIGLENKIIFLIETPTVFIYYFAFLWLDI